MIVAIHPDEDYGKDKCYAHWSRLLKEAGYEVRLVDVYQPDILKQLEGCDGFMWRFVHKSDHLQIARRLLPVIERELGG